MQFSPASYRHAPTFASPARWGGGSDRHNRIEPATGTRKTSKLSAEVPDTRLRPRCGSRFLARELDGRGVRRNGRAFEHDLAVVLVHDHRLAGLDLLPQELLGQ